MLYNEWIIIQLQEWHQHVLLTRSWTRAGLRSRWKMKVLSQRKNPKSRGENFKGGIFFKSTSHYCYWCPWYLYTWRALKCLCPVHETRQMTVKSISVPLCSCRKVPDHVVLSEGLNNRYWVLDVEEKPGLKTLTVSYSKTLHLTEKCLLKDGW